MLKREGWEVNAKRIYRLYTEEGLIVRTQKRRERAQRQRIPSGQAVGPNQKWSMDFGAQRLADGRWIRVLTGVDQFTRECLVLHADTALSGEKVALALDVVVAGRGAPQSITVDNGTEFASRAMDLWAYQSGVHLDFIRPGRPVENGYIESFNGRLRDECLNVEVFFTLADARRKLALWHHDYNHHRPHSALDDRTPAEFAALRSRGIDIGMRSLAFPVTPPCIRVRTRRFVRIKPRQCSATEEVPSGGSKWLGWHRRELVCG